MAYVQPNTIIEVMENVPITPSYNDTLYFGTYLEQDTYFSTQVKYTFSKQYYQRVGKNRCRVEKNAEQLYGCNYMRFKNYAYGNKWFYAFIVDVEYINDNCSEISYEIDELQTWYFDMVLGQCFVEREHSATDVTGEHLLPEPIDAGDNICESYSTAGFTELSIVLMRSKQEDEELVPDYLRDGIFNDAVLRIFPFTQAGAVSLKNDLDEIFEEVGGADQIISVYLAPTNFVVGSGSSGEYPHTNTRTINKPTTIAGFQPKNKKLLTFPYSYLAVDTLNDVQVYKWERFKSSQATFETTGNVVGVPTVLCAPINYELGSGTDYTHEVIMGGYPVCSLNIQTYKQWIANNFEYLAVGATNSIGGIALGLATGGMGAISGAVGLAKTLTDISVESQRANTARGAVSNNINAQNRSKDIYFKYMGLPLEKARSIDEFFSRYGYACERVKVPNIHVRARWTYTKTRGCVVKGKLPASSSRKIAEIFDHGVTFWVGPVGDYSLDNGVL